MNFDSQKVFIGLIDSISILLLTWLLMGEMYPIALGNRCDLPIFEAIFGSAPARSAWCVQAPTRQIPSLESGA